MLMTMTMMTVTMEGMRVKAEAFADNSQLDDDGDFDQNNECVGDHVDVIRLTIMKNMMTFKAEGMRVKAEAYKNYGDAALVSMVLEVLPHLAGEVIVMIMILMTVIIMIMTMIMRLS